MRRQAAVVSSRAQLGWQLIPTFACTLVLLFATASKSSAGPLVHPGDTINVNVANYAALIDDSMGRLKDLSTGDVVVAADGSVSIPVAGTVKVAGMSTRQIESSIELRLAAYVRDPSVTVRLVQQAQNLFLTGATVGTLPFLPGETLSTALGELRQQFEHDASGAQAPQQEALSRVAIDWRKVVLERDGTSGSPVDGEALIRSGAPGPVLEPGDTLHFINKPIRVDVTGQVASPGDIYLYPEDTLEEALLAAGGPLGSASTVDASLTRDGRSSALPLAGSAILEAPENGDTIVVRAAPHVNVLGQVANPGELTLKNGSSLLVALYDAGGPNKWANVRDIQVIRNGTRSTYDLTGMQHGDLSQNVVLNDGDVVYIPEGHKIDGRLIFSTLLGSFGTLYDIVHF